MSKGQTECSSMCHKQCLIWKVINGFGQRHLLLTKSQDTIAVLNVNPGSYAKVVLTFVWDYVPCVASNRVSCIINPSFWGHYTYKLIDNNCWHEFQA